MTRCIQFLIAHCPSPWFASTEELFQFAAENWSLQYHQPALPQTKATSLSLAKLELDKWDMRSLIYYYVFGQNKGNITKASNMFISLNANTTAPQCLDHGPWGTADSWSPILHWGNYVSCIRCNRKGYYFQHFLLWICKAINLTSNCTTPLQHSTPNSPTLYFSVLLSYSVLSRSYWWTQELDKITRKDNILRSFMSRYWNKDFFIVDCICKISKTVMCFDVPM